MSDAVYGTAGRSIAIHREQWQAPAAQEKSSSRKFWLSRLRRFFGFDFFSKSNHFFGLRRFFKGAAPGLYLFFNVRCSLWNGGPFRCHTSGVVARTGRPMKMEIGKFPAAPPRGACLLYTSPSPRDVEESRMPSSA